MDIINKNSRRDFLKLMSVGTCGAALHRVLGPVGGLLAFARPLEAFADSNKIFILLNFSGGVSYNIAPPLNSTYFQRNPSVSYQANNSLVITPDQALHPALTSLKSTFDEGNLAVFNLVGYPNLNRSHDEATAIWQTGSRVSTGGGVDGWGARLSSQMASAFGGVSLSGSNNFVKGGTNTPRVISNLDNLGLKDIFYDKSSGVQFIDTGINVLLDDKAPKTPAQEYVRESVSRLQSNVESLKAVASAQLPVQFPNTGMGQSFRDAAKLIAAGPTLNVNVIYLEKGGFDTHSNEKATLAQLLTEVNGGLAAFVACMKAMGRWNDVVIATMTEFTRTFENNSKGTDHGGPAPLFVLGGSIKGGQKTPAPQTADVAMDDYIKTKHCNFSQVFGEIVSWQGFDPTKVFPYPELSPSPFIGMF